LVKQREEMGMLFRFTGNYTPKALEEMRKSPGNRREAVEKLLAAAGGNWLPCMSQLPKFRAR
jgi:hypothetical protein